MADAVSFTITQEGGKGPPPKQFTLKKGATTRIRLGRAPGNDFVVEFRGVSQYHAELRLLPEPQDGCRLCVRDLSMNGTGMRKTAGVTPATLPKGRDEPLPSGAVILIPMLLKATGTSDDRGWLKVEVDDKPQTSELEGDAGKRSDRRDAKVDDDTGSEKNRMQFVELLLKAREVSAGTTYEDARRILGTLPAWHAVDEQTRKECFEIFTTHLGNHQTQKKEKKKKDKGKEKDKTKKRKRDDAAPEDAEENETPVKSKKHKAGSDDAGSANGERRQKSKKEKKSGRQSPDKARGRRRRRSKSP